TGAKSAQGRRRSANNAFRHGLSLPVPVDCALSEQAEGLIQKIAGPSAPAELRESARRIVEAQLQLRRVRHARDQLVAKAFADYNSEVSRAKAKDQDLNGEARFKWAKL